MTLFFLTAIFAVALVGLCVIGMAIGLIVRGKPMRGGGCGAPVEGSDGSSSCSTCGKKSDEACPQTD